MERNMVFSQKLPCAESDTDPRTDAARQIKARRRLENILRHMAGAVKRAACGIFAVVLLAGCSAREAAPPDTDPQGTASSNASQEAGLPDVDAQPYMEALNQLHEQGALTYSWQDSPGSGPLCNGFKVEQAAQDGEFTDITVELYGTVYLDPENWKESIEYGPVAIMAEDTPQAPFLAFGKAVVRFREESGEKTPLSCAYEAYSSPGLDYLKRRTAQLASVLEESPRLDYTKYDGKLLDYVWKLLLSSRYIESPEEITLYDLEGFKGTLELYQYDMIGGDPVENPAASLDASLLALLPNLETAVINCRLKDYGVFEGMHKLKKLDLYGLDDTGMATLRIGHTDDLSLYDPELSTLDLTHASVDTLRLYSWGTAVGGFAHCDQVKSLYIMSTKTDMRLVNATAFPNVGYMNLYFYSDMPRVRDFSQLSTFRDTVIDLCLDYQACNNETIKSLAGVRLNDLFLNPQNGSYPLDEPEEALVEQLTANLISWEADMYFQERTAPEQ